MHPLLARKKRLGLYLLGWVPVAGLLWAGMAGDQGPVEAAAQAAGLALAYAFAGLSTWYLCRAFPLGTTSAAKLVLAHLAAAAALSGLWVLLAWGLGPATRLPMLFGFGVLLAVLSAALHYVWLAVEASREAQRRAMAAQVAAREAELKALKAQINPHFLFNSLHSISALTSVDPARARKMCVLLSDFLRSTLGLGEKTSVALAEELALARNYLAVEGVRFGARLKVREEIEDGCHACAVPPLLVQPLVENAITHGISTLAEGGEIRIEARRSSRALRLVVENDFDPQAPPRRKSGMGLRNVRTRLEARYGQDARLEAGALGGRWRVEVLLPVEEEEPR